MTDTNNDQKSANELKSNRIKLWNSVFENMFPEDQVFPNFQFSALDIDFELYNGQFYCKTNILQAGDSFDDRLIIQQRQKHGEIQAIDTIKFDEKTILASMEIKNFNRAVKKIDTRKVTKLVEFLQGIPCF